MGKIALYDMTYISPRKYYKFISNLPVPDCGILHIYMMNIITCVHGILKSFPSIVIKNHAHYKQTWQLFFSLINKFLFQILISNDLNNVFSSFNYVRSGKKQFFPKSLLQINSILNLLPDNFSVVESTAIRLLKSFSLLLNLI